jgi:pyroglutamyl-peptidase
VRSLVTPLLLCASACANAPIDDNNNDPNAGLLRDFLDGKFDAAGHPLNAKVLDAAALCGGSALVVSCEVALPDGARSGPLMANLRLRVRDHASHGTIVTLRLGTASETLTVARLRDRDEWIDLPVTLQSGSATALRIEPASTARVEVDYVEVFPARFGLVIDPGSGVIDRLTFEVPRQHKLEALTADNVDLMPRLDDLLASGLATRTTTELRTLIDVAVADLVPERGDVTELRARAGNDNARVQLRGAAAACAFEGDPFGTRVLVTGFQPFPAAGTHENVSGVAVTAMNPANLRNAQVMRLVLPVEYDRAAAAIADVIERCAPDVVISFGQGGGAIALEEVAYNLQDTGEISGGAPDNRGVIRAAQPIDAAAPAERPTLLPIDAIESALVAIGEAPQHSTDPGRYICNNVMFVNIATMGPRGGRAGFIHLPFTTQFDDAVRARFARVVETAIQATVDAP